MDECKYTRQREEYCSADRVDIEQYQFEEEYRVVDEDKYQYMFYRQTDMNYHMFILGTNRFSDCNGTRRLRCSSKVMPVFAREALLPPLPI